MSNRSRVLCVLVIAMLLIFLIAQDFLSVVSSIWETSSDIRFLSISNGFYDSSVILFTATVLNFTTDSSVGVSFLENCVCKIDFHSAKNRSLKNCTIFEHTFMYPRKIHNGSIINFPMNISIAESPQNLSAGEFLRMKCNSDVRHAYSILVLP